MYEFDYKRMARADSEVKILQRDKKKLETKVKQLDGSNQQLTKSIVALEENIKSLSNILEEDNKRIMGLCEQCEDLKIRNDKLMKENIAIRKSVSYKIGRIICFIPRKVKLLFQKNNS